MKYTVYGLFFLALFLHPGTLLAQGAGERVQFGQDIVIEADEVTANAVCIGCSIRVHGKVNAEAVAIGGGIEIDGTVGAEAVAVGGNIRLGPNAKVGGDVVSVGGRIDRDPTATVGGNVQSTPGPFIPSLGGVLLFILLVCAAINLVLVLLAYLIAGEARVATIAGTVRARAGLALLTGVGVLVGAVLLFILSALIGPMTPILAILVSLALFITLVLGYTGLSSWFGRLVARESAAVLAVLLGALLITILQLIPFLGFLIFLVFVLLALGSAALSGYGTATDWLQRQFAARTAVPPASPPAAG